MAVGASSGLGINSILQNFILGPLQNQQNELQTTIGQLSSGNRLTSASIDPSGLAIYNNLTSQAASFDAASGNAADAQGALNVAEGALQTTTDSLQSLRNLAVQASNDLLSPQQRNDLQVVANQLVQQINTNAQNANFNGTPLLNGTFGASAPTAAAATTTANSPLAGGGTLAGNVTTAGNATAGTVNLSVVNNGGAAGVQVSFTNSATGAVTNLGVQAPGSTVNVNGTSITLGAATTQDTGATATVQVQGASAGSTAANANVQTGANEGSTTALSTPNATSQALFIQNIDLSSSANATNAIGQIDEALGATTSARATLGAQGVALGQTIDNNNTASNALTSAASGIGDTNVAASVTELYKLKVQNQISFDTLANANSSLGFLNRFFNVGA